MLLKTIFYLCTTLITLVLIIIFFILLIKHHQKKQDRRIANKLSATVYVLVAIIILQIVIAWLT